MNAEFKDKVVLITGAASGIGRAAALAFAKQGAVVVISDMAIEAGQETVRLVDEAGGQGHFISTDVADIDSVTAMVMQTVGMFGRLDVAINNAGVGGRGANVADYTFEDWHQVININLNGVFYCMKFQIQEMMKNSGGVIVNTSSIAGLRGLANSSAYSASKHGVIGLTKSAALEYARHGIRINAVCPVFTRTPLFDQLFEARPDYEEKLLRNIPMKRYGQPDDIAQVMLYLCSEAAVFMTGVAVPVDGGLTAR